MKIETQQRIHALHAASVLDISDQVLMQHGVYIYKDSTKQFIERLFETVSKLKDLPELGRRVPEAEERKDVRELIFQGYRIIYLTQTNIISIITVIHDSRNLSEMKEQPWNNNQ